VSSTDLADHLDWMFRHVILRVAEEAAEQMERLTARGAEQLAQYDEPMPVPDDEPELRLIIEPLLSVDPARQPDDVLVREVLRRVRTYIKSENKRKNLLGRGFEDVLAGVIERLNGPQPQAMGTQTAIENIPGFRARREGDKTEKVDLWVSPDGKRRVLVTAKWSVRSDREKQMRDDFLTYVSSNERREPFEYVWITNEFDPARLVANATNTEGNQYLFDAVVHVCPEALRLVHELDGPKLKGSPARLRGHLDSGRIIGLGDWLDGLRG